MSDQRKYVPILRAKLGEFRALRELDPALGESTTPLFEVQPVPRPSNDPKTGKPRAPKPLEQFLKESAKNIIDATVDFPEVWIDDKSDRPDVVPGSSDHPLEHLFAELGAPAGRSFVPALGLSRPAPYLKAATAIASTTGRLALRLTPRDLQDPSAAKVAVSRLLHSAGLEAAAVDLVLDVAAIDPDVSGTTQAVVAGLIPLVPSLADWRTFTLAITSFPVTPNAVVSNGSTEHLARECWGIWSWLASQPLPRTPTFGDYAVDNPRVPTDIEFWRQPIPMIRYTTEPAWLLLRGTGSRDKRVIKYPDLARELIAHSDYKGSAYSAGDDFIEQVATGSRGPGNATDWRFAAVNHHITQVAEQLASHP